MFSTVIGFKCSWESNLFCILKAAVSLSLKNKINIVLTYDLVSVIYRDVNVNKQQSNFSELYKTGH